MQILFKIVLLVLFISAACESPEMPQPIEPSDISILFLGDSYTIGQSVCDSCRYPAQLVDSLELLSPDTQIASDLVATTGWTTTNLLAAIETADLQDSYDYVYLLIGVNNQYQNKPFSLYEAEFPELLDYSINKANGLESRVNVISIPDYGFTPFGQNGNMLKISEELDEYNSFAKLQSQENSVKFISITDISRQGLQDFSLVAPDGLHPSTKQYTAWLARILPVIKEELF